jgi:hypothetical protein
MTTTVAMAFIVPVFDNLDVSFQGFNTWHSLQYLALTWFIMGARRRADGSEIASRGRSPARRRRSGSTSR